MNQNKIDSGYKLADLSAEQKELLAKVEHTTGLVLVAYDQSFSE